MEQLKMDFYELPSQYVIGMFSSESYDCVNIAADMAQTDMHN